MSRPFPAVRPVLILGSLVLVVLAVVAVVVARRGSNLPHPAHPIAGVASDVPVTIATTDGVTLSAEVITPRGSGPFPLVVMPGSWGAPATEYRAPGEQFAAHGFQVVSYAQRGAAGSGGRVDLAGSKTRADVSTVIDWALAHTRADSKRIGLLGVSYGAGISLLAAAHDKRIKALVAMSGWSDLAQALAPNRSPNVQAMHQLFDSLLQGGRLAGPAQQLAASLIGPGSGTESVLQSLTRSRSAADVLAALDANKPAIMLANAYQDSIVDPAQIVPFFERLTTPKRLQLAPGEHGGPEYAGLLGHADQTFTDALHWLDHYLRGTPNGIDRAAPIQLVDGVTGQRRGYRTWPAAGTTVYLGQPNVDSDVSSTAVPWTRQLTTGTDSGATSGPPFALQPNPYRPPQLAMSSVNPASAGIWTFPPATAPTAITGSPTLTLTVSSSTPATTFYAYLYDVDTAGSATLMTYAPETGTGATSLPLRPMSWTLAAGHHLALVLDTVDARYVSAAPSGSTITFSSTAVAPATLQLPTG